MRPAVLLAVVLLAGCAAEPPRLSQRATVSPGIVAAPSAVLSSEPWSFAGDTGRVIRTRRHRVFTTSTKPLLIDRLPGFLEASLDHYTSALAPLPEPPAKLDTYLMHTRGQWTRLTRTVMRDRADLYLRIQRGGFAAAGRGIYRDLGELNDTFNLAAHEGWHQYTQLTFRSRLPVYLEEGVATYMEGFRWDPQRPNRPVFLPWANLERFRTLRATHAAGRLMPLGELVTVSPQSLIAENQDAALVWYAQVWALVHFLQNSGDPVLLRGLQRMLRDAAAGTLRNSPGWRGSLGARGSSDALFETYLGASPDELDAAYQLFIRRVVAPGSQNDVTAGRNPL